MRTAEEIRAYIEGRITAPHNTELAEPWNEGYRAGLLAVGNYAHTCDPEPVYTLDGQRI